MTLLDERCAGTGVAEEVVDLLRVELGVEHHDDSPHLQHAEQRRHVGDAVAQREDHALLRQDPCVDQQVRIAIRLGLDLRVGHGSVFEVQRDAVASPLGHPRVEEVVGDLELGRRDEAHASIG